MAQPKLIKIKGTIADLHVWQGHEQFVMGGGTQAAGGAAAAGLAGAAATAVYSTSDTEDEVDYFTCILNGKVIFGRFGDNLKNTVR